MLDSVHDAWSDLTGESEFVARMLVIVGVIVLAVVAERISVRLLRRAYWRRVERASSAADAAMLRRTQREQTIVTLLESLARYAVYGAALVIVMSVVSDGASSALFGASLVVVLVGFGMQRLLGDMVAGALLLFERHFAVGDVITVHSQNVTGTVEAFSLRTTALRTLGGDRVTVMNGSIQSFTRWSDGQRDLRIDAIVRGDAAEVGARVEQLCVRERDSTHALWVRSPSVEAVDQAGTEVVHVIVRTIVAPDHEALADRFAQLLSAEFGDDLVGDADVVPVYAPAFESYRSGLIVRE